MKSKKLVLAIALVLVAMVAVVGTLAWLTDQTQAVKNTFTAGDIDIKLTETGAVDKNGDEKVDSKEFKMVPGNTLSKDPTVSVEKGSEASWVFVKVEKSTNFDKFMTYEMADGWNMLGGTHQGIYYREVGAASEDISFNVIKGNVVTVKKDVTKAELNDLTDETFPTLTFTAYAIQKDNIPDAKTAWAELNK